MRDNFTIGADPEIILTDCYDNIVEAGSVLRRASSFGVDGHSFIAELRPVHGTSPFELTRNIGRLLNAGNIKLPTDLKWLSGPWKFERPLG